MKNYEYNDLLKEKLNQIKEKNKDIVELVGYLDCRNSYKNMFLVFLSTLKNVGVKDDLYKQVEQMMIEKSNVDRTLKEHETIFGISSEDREVYTLDEMLCKCATKNGASFFNAALEYVVNQHKSNKSSGNIIDSFLAYIVANNYDDIEYGIWKDANFSSDYYESTIYGYPIGRMFLETITMDNGKDVFSIESLHIRRVLQGLRIGDFLLQRLMKDMSEKHPGELLALPTVMMSNINAIKMYARFGGKFFVDRKLVKDPIEGMDHSIDDNCWVVFTSDTIDENARKIIDKPIKKLNDIIYGDRNNWEH